MKLNGIKKALVASGLVFGLVAAQSAQAQVLNPSDLGLTPAQARALLDSANAPAGSPGIAFGSPVAFGADFGTVFAGIGGNTLPKAASSPYDGGMAVGFGLGNATKYVGLETSVSIISLRDSGPNDSFAHDGSVALKLHKSLPGSAAFAVGVENIGRWGNAKSGRSSVFAVGTKVFKLAPNASNKLPLAVNLGIGDNRFEDVGKSGSGFFGGVAFLPFSQMSVIADWTGRDLNAGVSVSPLRKYPLTVTVGAINLTENNNNSVEFSGGLGYSWSFN